MEEWMLVMGRGTRLLDGPPFCNGNRFLGAGKACQLWGLDVSQALCVADSLVQCALGTPSGQSILHKTMLAWYPSK